MKRYVIGLLLISLFIFVGCSDKKSYIFAYTSDNPPYIYEENGKLKGLEKDLLDAISQKSGFTYKIEKIEENNIKQSIEARDVDAVLSSLRGATNMEGSTNPIADVVVAVASINNTGNGLEVLQSKKVGTYKYSRVADFALQYREKYGYSIKYFETVDELYKNLLSGGIDFIVDDTRLIKELTKKNSSIKIHYKKSLNLQYVIQISKEKLELKNIIDKGLIELINSGSYDKIVSRYN